MDSPFQALQLYPRPLWRRSCKCTLQSTSTKAIRITNVWTYFSFCRCRITLDHRGVRNQSLQSTAADAILIASVWAWANDRCRSTLRHSGSLQSTATNTIYVTNLWTVFTLHLIDDRFKATLLADGSRVAVFDTAIVDGADGADSAVQSWRTALGFKATILADGSRGAVFDAAIVDGAYGANSAVQSWRTTLGWGSKDACHEKVSIKDDISSRYKRVDY